VTVLTCAFCGGPSTLLCDGRIATVAGKEYRVPAAWMNTKTRSCDAQVCRSCAKKIGDVHLNIRGGCRWDTRDLCPACQGVADSPVEITKVAQ
jgi:hypothetical protein